MKFLRQFQYTSFAVIATISLVCLDLAIGSDFFAWLVSFVERTLTVETDHFIVPGVFILATLIIDFSAQSRERKIAKRSELQRQQMEISAHRLRVLKATMLTVQDIVGNMQQGLQLFRLEYEDTWSKQELELFDSLMLDTATRLQALGNLEATPEIEMAAGTGIDYQGVEQFLKNKSGPPTLLVDSTVADFLKNGRQSDFEYPVRPDPTIQSS
ncbi:MAG TPA: hypothetical protein VFC63_18070 [Blastocatellia bacterium]|nr:hypothetical protein [Blastocatellia bacterium]